MLLLCYYVVMVDISILVYCVLVKVDITMLVMLYASDIVYCRI